MPEKHKYNFPEGEILLINKPLTWTSFDVVNFIRKFLRATVKQKVKVGHAGTLDPLATGLLIVCTGRATKRINEFMGLDKEYTGIFYIGGTTPTYDRETKVDQNFKTDHITRDLIFKKKELFIGKIQQTPPIYSAVKIEGKPAYIYARKDKPVKIKSREVEISEFDITRIELPEIDFRISCGKGTYIRSLAHDFGKALNSGAYLLSLSRTRIGDYHLNDAIDLEEFKNRVLINISDCG